MRKSLELKNELGTLTEQYRAELSKIEVAGRKAPNADEKSKLEQMDADMDALSASIQLHEKQEAREAAGQQPGRQQGGNPTGDPQNANGKAPRNAIRASAEYKDAFSTYLRTGKVGNVSPDIQNALQADNDTSAGYLTASEEFSDQLIEVVDNQVFMRGLATVTKLTSAQSLGFPVRESDVDDAEWTSELATGSETSLAISKREFRPHPLAKRIKLSKKLLRLSPSVQALVIKRLGYKFGVSGEKAYLTGDGAGKPLGVFTPSANGISTGRDVSTGATTDFTADALIDALYTLKAQYMATATWMFHRDAVRKIRKLKDSYGQYLWQPGLSAAQPDRILNRPFVMSEYAPNTFTTGQYVGIVGDFTKYEIVDALDIEIQVLTELYAEQNVVGYIGRMETDGMPVLEEAFVRLKTA
jgi:HK97 family phage major capsid protein